MLIKSLKDLKKLGFIIEEVINNVTESSTVVLDDSTTLEDIADFRHTSNDSYFNYEASFTRYQVIKKGTVVSELLEAQELIAFFKNGEYLNYLEEEVAGEMNLTKDEYLLIDSIRNPDKYTSSYRDYLTYEETNFLEKYRKTKE